MAEFAALASPLKANDYIPVDTQDVIVHTKLIGGGETTTIEFDAPAVGTYDFICSFPAHFAMMNGKFIVE
jgi:azurin